MEDLFYGENLKDYTICSRARDGECTKDSHRSCDHEVPGWTNGMLGVNGNCSMTNMQVEIVSADTDNPNVQFQMRKKNGL